MSSVNPRPTGSGPLEVEVHREVRIPTAEAGVSLAADLFLPVSADPVPAIVILQPYRRDMMVNFWHPSMRALAELGFACLAIEARGIGASDGEPRPRTHQDEGDDAVAAIEWAAAQTWCSGNVGMWGHSASGLTAMRAAALHPEPLKAIIPIMNPIDSQRYRGARGDLGLIVQWGAQMLLQQLMPPLANYTSVEAQQRWQRRLYDTVPFIMDEAIRYARHPEWKDRRVAVENITIPALCVGGWRDLHCDQIVRAFEAIPGPKKLLMGPWSHSLPHHSNIQPIDFLSLAVRWWDHWLRGVDNGIMDEPSVTLYVPGDQPEWRAFTSWPPSDTELTLSTDSGLTWSAARSEDSGNVEYLPDPTIGTLAGLGGENYGYGFPLDQHDDDIRSLSAISNPLPEDILICGRPILTVSLPANPAQAVQRLVARLTAVDPWGRSTLITTGLLSPDEHHDNYHVELGAVAHPVPAGHQLRIAVSDSDFPRLMPLVEPTPIRVAGFAASIPVVSGHAGEPVDVPTLPHSDVGDPMTDQQLPVSSGEWLITRDPIHNGVQVVIGEDSSHVSTLEGHSYAMRGEVQAKVRHASPDGAVIAGKHTASARMATGESISVSATVRCTQTAVWARGDVDIDGTRTFSHVWNAPLGHGKPESENSSTDVTP